MEPEFERHRPENLPEQAAEWLRMAAKRTEIGYIDADEYIKASGMTNDVQLYTIECDGELCAAFCLTFRETAKGIVMQLVLLGGKDVKKWRDALVEFMEATAAKFSCVWFTMMGPDAWGKLFPEIKKHVCIFGKIPKYIGE